MGGGPKANSNVPIVDVPKWLRRGGVRPNWDNVLKYGVFLRHPSLRSASRLRYSIKTLEITIVHKKRTIAII